MVVYLVKATLGESMITLRRPTLTLALEAVELLNLRGYRCRVSAGARS
jgi:hypothetical protein